MSIVGRRASPGAGPGCTIAESRVGSALVLSVSGALDALTAPQLDAALMASMAKTPSAIIVDLSGVDFLASAGMAVLVAARQRADGDAKFAVVADGPATSRPLRLVGLAELVGLHATIDEALAALSEG